MSVARLCWRAGITGLFVAGWGFLAAPAAPAARDAPPARAARVVPFSERMLPDTSVLTVRTPAGTLRPSLSIERDRGFDAVPASDLELLGWRVEQDGVRVIAWWRGHEPILEIRSGTPFLLWDGEEVQLAQVPYTDSGTVFLPLQLLVDVLPWKLPEVFSYDPETFTLELRGASPGALLDSIHVVVIDPGHGGRDSGARGPGGIREKDVAMGIARALARTLDTVPKLEVHLTRVGDTLIPLWKRGELATRWRGGRAGIFLSIHANAAPASRSTRGFETYFLSEARTEHERRVAALENAAQELEEEGEGSPEAKSDLTFILTELRNLDYQHWSATLAGLVQDELGRVHPGPNRGVKQGPFAVITNALMPAVLIEVGFLSNGAEERLLARRSFQEEAAAAIAKAVLRFFEHYPPEAGGGEGARETGAAERGTEGRG